MFKGMDRWFFAPDDPPFCEKVLPLRSGLRLDRFDAAHPVAAESGQRALCIIPPTTNPAAHGSGTTRGEDTHTADTSAGAALPGPTAEISCFAFS